MTDAVTAGPPVLDRRDAAVMRLLAALAMAAAAVWLIGAALAVLLPLLTDQGLPSELLLADGSLSAVGSLPEGVRALTATAAGVTVDASTLSGGAVALLLVEAGLTSLVGAIVSGSIAYALRRIARGEAFHRSMFVVAVVTGYALSIGMMVAIGSGGLGRMMAGDELNTLLGAEVFVVGFEASPVPVLIGFAVLGLAVVFRLGARLQRETEGLV
ncbi:hypothetical protein OVN18_03665 [Microcella daejeonensis]|uniref:DUF2975 domain-containing protein n=1 Tax=Microcella daejeonensis TaxID=2994971 RepID=A0A9E8MM15_9MICO|nr:hypothetical protein [Microcella daejeonensis]WAB82119.1 hypothetical protein OVN18_03665 [Microcella daejeonensis]